MEDGEATRAVDLSVIPAGQREVVARRLEGIERYLRDLPPRKGGRVDFAQRIATSIGVSRTQFYTLVKLWLTTGDAARLGDRTGVQPGTPPRQGYRDHGSASVMAEEIAAAGDQDTDVEVRRRIADRMPGRNAPSLPTIARHRRGRNRATGGERLEEAVSQALVVMEALSRGTPTLADRPALRAAERVAAHLGLHAVAADADDIATHGSESLARRIGEARHGSGILLLVCGVEGTRDKRMAELRSLLSKGDRMACVRRPDVAE